MNWGDWTADEYWIEEGSADYKDGEHVELSTETWEGQTLVEGHHGA